VTYHHIVGAHLESKDLRRKGITLVFVKEKVLPQPLLLVIICLDYHPHKQIHDEKRAKDDHSHEKETIVPALLVPGNQIRSPTVDQF
jgi:hypothetical protein